mmetsp:Transcript_21203/g.70084  ORF Transcript_21203/g.70084 Transcript_21203/m.70084 type:complete len:93 (+) Transcript_21203:2-280(+)
MFSSAIAFDQDLGGWNPSSVTAQDNMYYMFTDATAFAEGQSCPPWAPEVAGGACKACEDTESFCGEEAAAGMCDANRDYMIDNCAASCGFCE